MWPLSWYRFCDTGSDDIWSCSVSASPDSTLCFTLLAASRSCWACVQWQRVQCSRASQQPWATQHREESVVCHLCRPCPPYTRHDLLSLETAATPPRSLSPQLIARLSHLGILPRKPRRSKRGGKNEWRKIKVIVGFRDRLSSDSSSSPTPCQLAYHLPLHPATVTTSQPPRSALRCVPLTDSCFTFPLVLPQPKTHLLSASSMQDPSALPGGGPTYPPSFRTTTSTSCCWRRLAAPCRWRGQDRRPCSAWVLGPLLPPLCRGVRRKRRGHRLRHKGLT